MSGSYDIFLSHSGAQKGHVEQLHKELKNEGRYSVFYDKESIKIGEQISPIILEYAKTCKVAVAILSEDYFTRSRWPMMELAASYTAAKDGNGVPCLLPVFFKLKPGDAKEYNRQLDWFKEWERMEVNEIMDERRNGRTLSRFQPTVWKEALHTLLGVNGPIYKPHECEKNPAMFWKIVAQDIARTVDRLSITTVPIKVEERVQQYEKYFLVGTTFTNYNNMSMKRELVDQETNHKTGIQAVEDKYKCLNPIQFRIMEGSFWATSADKFGYGCLFGVFVSSRYESELKKMNVKTVTGGYIGETDTRSEEDYVHKHFWGERSQEEPSIAAEFYSMGESKKRYVYVYVSYGSSKRTVISHCWQDDVVLLGNRTTALSASTHRVVLAGKILTNFDRAHEHHNYTLALASP